METVRLERHGWVALLTLNRPERMNALSKPLLESLDSTFLELASDSEIRVVVLTGAGDRAFSAGADITEQRGFSADDAYAHMRWGQAIFDRIETFPKPTIAAINGVAFGGGLELALACDLRLIASSARVGLPEITLASFPGWGGTQRLPALIGASRAMRIMLTGEPVSAVDALAVGLVNEVVESEELLDRTTQLAESIAHHAPEALACLKSVVHVGLHQGREAGLEAEARGVGKLWGSPAQKAAQEAFFARKNKR
ncbi:enoyl-CoA hydratase/isomerase family protein [Paraburkholderia sp. HD33-4]|uniref:enoyl-CoA hydratase/isomerase family protein n=1 Tax=Paraburkholderia sp. HD33-4 TaxID=2883242 RepID=UPI001F1BF687|nr:enoyl-CoA hydratase/isomerase family protein [Paraburkholderia sp. HD33-4]